MNDRVYGIDLGTTYSAIARITDFGAAEIIANFEGDQTTPSVVVFDGPGLAIVGAEAKRVAISDPDNACLLIKRRMGTDFPQEFQGEVYSPEAISALILKELVSAANQALDDEVSKVVITVPAYFGTQERQSTRQAGEMAGLDVVGIVTEPVAAALSIGMRGDSGETVLIYDLGGGTFDTTIMRLDRGEVRVLAVDGNRMLGGADWDDVLMTLVIDKFIAESGLGDDDPRYDEDFMLDLRLNVETAKKALTKRDTTMVRCVYGAAKSNITVTRAEFEEATRPLIGQTIDICRRTLETATAKQPDVHIDRVLLVGGSSRMPMVREALGNAFAWPVHDTEFDLAVAKGAAIYGQAAVDEVLDDSDRAGAGADDITSGSPGAASGSKHYLGDAHGLTVTNVLSRGVGIRFARDEHDEVGYIKFFAHANDAIPATPDPFEAVTVSAGQREVAAALFEQGGERESEIVADNRLLKEADLPLPPGLPKESPIEIRVNISSEGLVTMVVTDPVGGDSIELEAAVSVLDEAQIAEETSKVASMQLRS